MNLLLRHVGKISTRLRICKLFSILLCFDSLALSFYIVSFIIKQLREVALVVTEDSEYDFTTAKKVIPSVSLPPCSSELCFPANALQWRVHGDEENLTMER